MPKGQTVNKLILILFAASTLQAQEQPQTVLYKAAVIHTADKGTIENAQMLVTDGIIQAIGQNLRGTRQTKVVDLGKLHLYPGLIAATTSLGLTEINAVRATQDTTEVGEFTPDLEELPVLLEEYIEDLIHEVSGITVKDVTVEKR